MRTCKVTKGNAWAGSQFWDSVLKIVAHGL